MTARSNLVTVVGRGSAKDKTTRALERHATARCIVRALTREIQLGSARLQRDSEVDEEVARFRSAVQVGTCSKSPSHNQFGRGAAVLTVSC